MKKFLLILVIFTAVLGFAGSAHAGLNLSVVVQPSYGYHRSSAYYNDGYYGRPAVRYYSRSYYTPRARRYYSRPVYYRSSPRYSRRYHRGYR